MIFGIGTDLCDAGRMEKSLTRQSFVNHVFSPQEQDQLNTLHGKHRAESAAANFAAKEAFLKACGTGLAGFALNEIAALRDERGAPYLAFSGRTAEFMETNQLSAHLSLTHEADLAAAFVVLERG